MNTKLKKWASAFVDYYFKNTTSDKVCLVISKEDIPLVYQFHESYIKFPDRKVNALEEFMRCFMKEKSLPNNPTFKSYHLISKAEFEQSFVEVVEESIKSKQPYYLPYIALFIMPLTDDDIVTEGERRDNYYERLEKFINDTLIPIEGKKQSIKSKKDNWLANNKFPNGIQNNLTKMWGDLQEWICLNFPNKWEFKSSNRHRHIGPFLAEATLTSSQKKRFPKLFIDADIQPNSIISIDEAKHIISSYGKEALTGYSDAEWREITQDDALLEILVDAFFDQYNGWDGESRITRKVKLNDGRLVEQESNSGTTIGIRLIYSQNLLDEASFCFKAFKKDFSESIELSDGKVIGFRRSGWAKNAFKHNAVAFLEGSYNKIELFRTDKYTGNYHKSPVYIFEQISDESWATTNRIKKGEDYLIMLPPDSEEGLTQWITKNDGLPQNVEGLPYGYNLYLVQNIITGYAEIPALRIRTSVSITQTSGVILDKNGYDITLSNSKPLEFEVDGLSRNEISMDAVFADGSKKEFYYNKENRRWRLNSIQRSQIGCSFRIVINGNRAYDRHNYTIVEPDINIVNLPSKNIFGQIDKDGCFNGLNSSYTIDNVVNSLSNDGEIPECCEIYEHKLDEFIYDLSSTNTLSVKQFRAIMNHHIKDEDDALDWFELVSDLDKNGYVEMTYSKETNLYINPIPPTLVMVPVNFQKENMMGLTRLKPMDYCYRGILLGGRSKRMIDKFKMIADEIGISYDFQSRPEPLMPVTISLYSRDWSAFKTIASELGLIFKENSFYCASVIERIPNIIDYLNNVVLRSSPTYKYSPDYRTSKGFKCFDYSALTENFSKRLNGEKSFNRFLKSSFDPELDLVQYPEDIILWYQGNAYNVDRYWGHFLVCALMGITDIIQSAPSQPDTISLPSAIKLPTLIARALTLVTGELPHESNGIRTYKLANNPCMSCLEAEAIKRKLLNIQ